MLSYACCLYGMSHAALTPCKYTIHVWQDMAQIITALEIYTQPPMLSKSLYK